MKLTNESVKTIKLGDVVQFFWFKDNGERHNSSIGVVYSNDKLGIRCNRDDGTYFGYWPAAFDGSLSFEILADHAPVALYGSGYDFVSNHPNQQ